MVVEYIIFGNLYNIARKCWDVPLVMSSTFTSADETLEARFPGVKIREKIFEKCDSHSIFGFAMKS